MRKLIPVVGAISIALLLAAWTHGTPANSFLLLEDNSFLLLEDGSKLILE